MEIVKNKTEHLYPKNPTLSIVMLMHNDERWEKYGAQRMQEVQSLDLNLELLIIANTELNESTIRQMMFAQFPVTLIKHYKNHIPAARNLGTQYAKGKYILSWDDDDGIKDSRAISILLDIFETSDYRGVLCAPLLKKDGSPLHPKKELPHQEINRFFVFSMLHTPFLIRKSTLVHFPLSEVRILRGEWVELSARLWRAGVPICYLKDNSYYFQDNNHGNSATRCNEVLFHVLLSLGCVALEYDFSPESYSGQILKKHYFDPRLDGCDEDRKNYLWRVFLSNVRNGGKIDFEEYSASFISAMKYLNSHRDEIIHFRDTEILPKTLAGYNYPPYGFFENSNGQTLLKCLQ